MKDFFDDDGKEHIIHVKMGGEPFSRLKEAANRYEIPISSITRLLLLSSMQKNPELVLNVNPKAKKVSNG